MPGSSPTSDPAPDWVELLAARARHDGDKPAYTFLDTLGREAARWSYADLEREARRYAAAIEAAAPPAARVLLVLPSSLEYVAAFFGCLCAGAVAVPVLPPRPNRPQHRLLAVAEDCGARIAITTERLAPRLSEALGPGARVLTEAALGDPAAPRSGPGPEALAFLQYTSGSTAAPKGVRVTHGQLLANQRMMGEAFETAHGFSVVGWLPMHHDMGLIGNVLHPLYRGAPCVLMAPETFLMRPIRWLEAISRFRATTSGAPNFAYDLCVERIPEAARAALDLSCWRVAYDGAEPVRQATLQRFAEAFAPAGFAPEALTPCYGLAEATLLVSAAKVGAPPRVDEAGRVCCGRPPSGVELRIVDPERHTPCAEGEEGEIWVRGPAVADGYEGRPEESRQTFAAVIAGEPSGEAFLRTGDLGRQLDGELFVTGRCKDLIVLSGQNYHPQDLEACAEAADPDVQRGAVAAFGYERGGRERVAVVAELHRHAAAPERAADRIRERVSLDTGITLDEVRLIRQGTLPRTTSGKVRRSACREALLRGDLAEVTRRST